MQKKLGFALSGGGARGLAHIGVLKALEKMERKPDYLSGTSMGAIIGAAYACGMKIDQLEKVAIELTKLRSMMKIVHLKQPLKGLVDEDKLRKMLSTIIPEDATFEKTMIPLSICATDLNTGNAVELRKGNLLSAVMASCALPGVFPPVIIGGKHLVDGGVLNNLPVDQAYRLGAEVVVAVDVQLRMDQHSFWQQEPAKPKLPQPLADFVHDMMRSETIMASKITELNMQVYPPSLYILVPVNKEITTLSGYGRAEEIIRVGEISIEKHADRIIELLN